MSACQTCVKRDMELAQATSNLSRAKGLFQRNGQRYDGRYVRELAEAKEQVALMEAAFFDHMEVEHDGVPPKTTVGQAWGNRIFKKAEQIPEGKAKCASCGKVVPIAGGGTRLRRHKTPQTDSCPNLQLADHRALEYDVPEVYIPELKRPPAAGLRRRAATTRRDRSEPSRLDVGSTCRECGKWLPGERIVCGRCSILRERAS